MTSLATNRSLSAAAPHTSREPGPPDGKVASVLARGIVDTRMTFPEGGAARLVHGWIPPRVSALEAGAAADRLRELEAALSPADRGQLLSRILALLSHYRGDPHPPEVEEMIADDWAEDLGGYPMWAVEAAARHWRRTRRFRPQISEMVALCDAAVAEVSEESRRLRSLRDRLLAVSSPQGARASAVVSELAARLGGARGGHGREGFRGRT